MEADDRESGSSVTLCALGNGLYRVASTLLVPQWGTRVCKISATDLLPVEPMVRAGASDPHLRLSLCFLNLLQAAFSPPMLNWPCAYATLLYIRLSILSVSCSFAHEVVSSICLHTVQPQYPLSTEFWTGPAEGKHTFARVASAACSGRSLVNEPLSLRSINRPLSANWGMGLSVPRNAFT